MRHLGTVMFVVSARIKINEASAQTLCQLNRIGPRRAERIICYREQVRAIANAGELATAAGISHGQARALVHLIDWTIPERPRTRAMRLALTALAVVGLLYLYGLATDRLDYARPGAAMYNSTLQMIFAGCLLILTSIAFAPSGAARPGLQFLAVAFWISGFVLLAALVIGLEGAPPDDFTNHVIASWAFGLYVLIVILVHFGPALAVRQIPEYLKWARTLYDYGQLPIALLISGSLLAADNGQTIDGVFGLWAGAIFIVNGHELARSRASCRIRSERICPWLKGSLMPTGKPVHGSVQDAAQD
jgi:hypothetical protein